MSKKEYFFIWKKESGESETIKLKNGMIFGRKKECDFSIPDQLVSGKHFEITLVGHTLYITDLKSFNKTFINEMDIKPDKKVALKENDVIQAGKQFFTFVHELGKKKTPVTSYENDSLKLNIENLKTQGNQETISGPKNDLSVAFKNLQVAMGHYNDFKNNPKYALSDLKLEKGNKKAELQDLLKKKEDLALKCVAIQEELEEVLKTWKSFF